MSNNSIRQVVNVVAVLATLVVNGLANALPLNGLTTAEISDRFQVYFVPAGYVFAIWGVIYLGLVLFAAYQALPAQRDNPRLARVGYLFALSCAANIAWLFLWHYEQFPLTVAAMLVLLVSLAAIYRRLGIGRAAVPTSERWLVHVPFSVYLGWVSVATIANVTATLDFLNWSGWGLSDAAWAVIMLAVGVALGSLMSRPRPDVAYIAVLIWAYVGIAVKQAGAAPVAAAALASSAVLAALLLLALWRGWAPRRASAAL